MRMTLTTTTTMLMQKRPKVNDSVSRVVSLVQVEWP